MFLGFQCVVFAAYGGGGGWASSITKSSVMLQRDVCPYGDYSWSWYDGLCESPETVYTPSGYTYQSADIEPTKTSPTEQNQQIHNWIVTRKTELSRDATMSNQALDWVKDLPLRYRAAQRQIDQIMAPWNELDPEVRNGKVVRLLTRIDTLLSFPHLPLKLRTILVYIQDKAVMMSSFQ